MTPQVHVNETIETADGKPVETPAPPAAVPQAVTPEWVPTATPPTPPRYPPVAPPRRGPSAGRWVLGLGLVAFGGLTWWLYGFVVAGFGFSLAGGQDFATMAVTTLVAAVPALTAFIAAWLLRTWPGMVVAAVGYIAVSALMWVLAIGGGPAGMAFWTVGFALYVVLPAVVLSVLGMAIGMAIAGRRG